METHSSQIFRSVFHLFTIHSFSCMHFWIIGSFVFCRLA